METILNFINNEWVQPKAKQYLDVYCPSNGQIYAQLASSQKEDVDQAVLAAQSAFPEWSEKSKEQRAEYLFKIAQGILNNLEKLAQAETKDNGKPINLARQVDIPRSAKNFDFFAKAITQFHGQFYRTDSLTSNTTDYSPLGAVACISPWNLPLYLLTWKIAPALAAGNTVVAKPSEITPLSAHLLSEIVVEAGLPPGVLNFVHGLGSEVGDPLVRHPEIKAVSFTGSTATGRAIAQATAPSFKKISLEMGGKNPNIIFADAPFDKALETTVRSSFANQGQICLCGSRIFVETPLYEKFKKNLVEKINQLKVGNPFSENTDQGALVSKDHLQKVMSYIELAKNEGGKILTGGKRPQNPELAEGYYLEPTLIEGLDSSCRTNQEEIFGPVATITPFETEDQVLAMANSTRYGLSASLWTNNLDRAQHLAEKLEAGIVWINTWMNRDLRTPFGGVKESGVGREGGLEALRFFSEVKNICTQKSEVVL